MTRMVDQLNPRGFLRALNNRRTRRYTRAGGNVSFEVNVTRDRRVTAVGVLHFTVSKRATLVL